MGLSLEVIAKFPPYLSTVKEVVMAVSRSTLEVEGKLPFPPELLWHTFFKALLTGFSHQSTVLSLVVSCLLFLSASLIGSRVGAGSKLSPGDYSSDTSFVGLER